MIPANGARLTMIFEQRIPVQDLEVINSHSHYTFSKNPVGLYGNCGDPMKGRKKNKGRFGPRREMHWCTGCLSVLNRKMFLVQISV